MHWTNKIILGIAMGMASQLNAQSIIGAWHLRNPGESKSDAIITFLANGTYTMAEDGKGRADSTGKDGMERGIYRWNPTTNAFSRKTLVDTTGQWGLSHANFDQVSVTSTKMTVNASDGKIEMNRIIGKGIVGSWYLKEGKGYAVATFLADGSYFMVQDGKGGKGGKTGMERGTYKWNPVTRSFTRKIIRDTNGTWGFSDARKRTVTISGNKLTMTVAGEGKFTLQRVIAAK
jgi:hypothetical protein